MKDLEAVFYRAEVFNRDVGAWDTSSVISPTWGVFRDAFAFNQPIGGWDVSLSLIHI